MPPRVASRDEFRDAPDHVRLRQKRRVPLVRHLDGFHGAAARPHGGDRRRRQQIGIRAAHHHQRHVGERVEFLPQRRQRPFEIDAFHGLGEPTS